jgi:hypothetical protein
MSGEQWATLESLNPSCFPSRSIARRGSARTLERFTIGRSKASQVKNMKEQRGRTARRAG